MQLNQVLLCCWELLSPSFTMQQKVVELNAHAVGVQVLKRNNQLGLQPTSHQVAVIL